MSIPDSLIYKYFKLATLLDKAELDKIKLELDDKNTNPRNLKVRLGFELVKKYHNEEAAKAALNEFETIFVKKEIPDDIPEYTLESDGVKLANLMKDTKMVDSTSEAVRLIKQGAVTIDGEKITDKDHVIKRQKDFVLKAGKRKFLKVKV
jgi:tyrosyl-tRNA synthetase